MNIKFLRVLDKYLFGFLILCLFWLKYFSVSREKPKKILVIRLWALGSSLLSFPMIKQLKDHYNSDIQLDLLATSRNIGVFKNQWYFNQIYDLFSLKWMIKMILSFKKYDVVVDMEEYFKISTFIALRSGKTAIGFGNLWNRKIGYTNPVMYNDRQHTVMTFLDLLKPLGIKTYIPDSMEPMEYQYKDTIRVDEFLGGLKLWTLNFKLICMHTWWAETAKERARPIKKWVVLIKEIVKKYNNVFIVLSWTHFEKKTVEIIIDSLNDMERKQVINICGMFNLYEFAYLLKKCDLMISNDTGPMHLATAMWTKTIGLFGPELPRKFGPRPLSRNVWLYKWDGNACIQVHLAIWTKDRNYWVDKISVREVMENVKI